MFYGMEYIVKLDLINLLTEAQLNEQAASISINQDEWFLIDWGKSLDPMIGFYFDVYTYVDYYNDEGDACEDTTCLMSVTSGTHSAHAVSKQVEETKMKLLFEALNNWRYPIITE